MKKKILIVIADYYQNIAKGLLNSSLSLIPKESSVKIIKVPGVLKYQSQYQKILRNMMPF